MQANLRALFWLSAVNNFHITAVYLEGANNTLADSISHIHEPKALSSFYSFLCAKFSAVFADSVPLTAHMSIHGLHFISCRSSGSYSGFSTQSRNPRISLPALRWIYEGYLQDTPKHIPSLLPLHGLHPGSNTPDTPSSICCIPSAISQAGLY